MIYTKLISGLGNQLFQYVIGRQLSIIKDVTLKLDISFYKDQNLRSYKLNHYNIKAEIATEQEISRILDIYQSKSLYAKLYRRIEKKLPKYRWRSFKENEWWVYEPELFKVTSNVYLDGYWQHYKYLENLNPQIFDELTIKERYNANINILLSEIKQNKDSVAIHIRRGDYISDSNAYNFMGVLPIEYYKNAIQFISKKINTPHLYFFSDDLDWVKDNLKTNYPTTFMDIEGGKKDYIELDFMSKCAHNIIANSSFSWWGAFLNRNPNKIVIAPNKWVLPEEVNSKINLQLPSWVKI